MQVQRLILRLSLGLTAALAPLAVEAAAQRPPQIPRCIRTSSYQVRRAPVRPPAPRRVVCQPIPRTAVIPRTPAAPPAPVALPPDRPLSNSLPSGNSFKPAILPSGPSYNVHGDAPDGSIAHSQQRQAIAIGAVAVAVGAAIWMASREHAAQEQADARPDQAPAAPRFDDPADAHAYAVQMALAKARKP